MTKTETARLVRVARSLAHYHISGTEKQFVCPLAYERSMKVANRGMGTHKFSVMHLPWEKGTTAPEVTKAFLWHLDMEECDAHTP
jgi:hypothetical protein